MPSRLTITPMDPLIGPHATSFPALSIASLGSTSLMIQVRISDPVPATGPSMGYSGFLQPNGTFVPGPAVAAGVILTLTYALESKSNMGTTLERTSTLTSVVSSTPFTSRLHPSPLSRQYTMAVISPGPARIGLPRAASSSKFSTTVNINESQNSVMWPWLLVWLLSVSISLYGVGVYQAQLTQH